MRVPVELQPVFSSGTPTKLFSGPYLIGSGRAYDVSPDATRFLMIKEGGGQAEGAPAPSLVVVQNWFQELESLVPRD
jgi:hypothetical protein